MKKKFPNPKNGTLGTNLAEIVKRFGNGVQYNASKDENQQDFGIISTCIGTVRLHLFFRFIRRLILFVFIA